MISYDSFASKMRKVKSVQNTIYHFRVLIITVLSIIFSSTSGFLISKGVVTKNVTIAEQIEYGEIYKFTEAEALFSDITYQFSVQGSDNWTNVQPTTPGDYSIRAVTQKSFNQTGYGKPVDFTITAKKVDLEITSESVIYGENPNINTSFLVGEDKLEKVSFEYENILAAETNVNADKDSIVITNKDGLDITNFYEFQEKKKLIAVNNRDICLRPVIEGKIYDGLTVDYDSELELSSTQRLANGDEITFSIIIEDQNGEKVEGLPKDAGNYTLRIDHDSVKIYNTNLNLDVTSKYNISYAEKNQDEKIPFEIEPREVTLKPINFENKIYDGIEYFYLDEFNNFVYLDNIEDAYKLVDGETIKIVIKPVTTKGYENIINADNYTLTIDDIIAGVGTRLENYKFTLLTTQFTIERRDVTLSPINFEDKVYDGIEYKYLDEYNNFVYLEDTLDANKVVEGDEVKLIIKSLSDKGFENIKNVDKYVLTIDSLAAGKTTILDNYNFTFVTTKFEITPRPVTLQSIRFEDKVYDGVEYVYSNEYNNFNYVVDVEEQFKLVKNEQVLLTVDIVSSKYGFTNIKNADIYTITIVDIKAGKDTLLENYTFTYLV